MALPGSQFRFQNPFGFSLTPWVRRLLLANVVVAVLGLFLRLSGFGDVAAHYLGLVPAQVLWRPWTLVTYLFVHGGVWHLLVNMIGLFFFGPPLEERWGSAEFLRFYLVAGLGGALLSFLTPSAMIVGASGAIFGILLAYAMAWPDNRIYLYGILPVKAKWLVTGVILFTLLGALGSPGSGVAHLAHLGGLASAFLYLKSPWAPNPFGGITGAPRERRSFLDRVRAAPRRSARASGPTRSPVRKTPAAAASPGTSRERELLADVDRILDKISQQGMASLTETERKRLDEVSRRYKTE
jgi:membrane associated rhomboid family serine protease